MKRYNFTDKFLCNIAEYVNEIQERNGKRGDVSDGHNLVLTIPHPETVKKRMSIRPKSAVSRPVTKKNKGESSIPRSSLAEKCSSIKQPLSKHSMTRLAMASRKENSIRRPRSAVAGSRTETPSAPKCAPPTIQTLSVVSPRKDKMLRKEIGMKVPQHSPSKTKVKQRNSVSMAEAQISKNAMEKEIEFQKKQTYKIRKGYDEVKHEVSIREKELASLKSVRDTLQAEMEKVEENRKIIVLEEKVHAQQKLMQKNENYKRTLELMQHRLKYQISHIQAEIRALEKCLGLNVKQNSILKYQVKELVNSIKKSEQELEKLEDIKANEKEFHTSAIEKIKIELNQHRKIVHAREKKDRKRDALVRSIRDPLQKSVSYRRKELVTKKIQAINLNKKLVSQTNDLDKIEKLHCRIVEETGQRDFELLSSQFLTQEEKGVNLTRFKDELEEKIVSLEQEHETVQAEYFDVQSRKKESNTTQNRQRIHRDDLEEELNQAISSKEKARESFSSLKIKLDMMENGIHNLGRLMHHVGEINPVIPNKDHCSSPVSVINRWVAIFERETDTASLNACRIHGLEEMMAKYRPELQSWSDAQIPESFSEKEVLCGSQVEDSSEEVGDGDEFEEEDEFELGNYDSKLFAYLNNSSQSNTEDLSPANQRLVVSESYLNEKKVQYSEWKKEHVLLVSTGEITRQHIHDREKSSLRRVEKARRAIKRQDKHQNHSSSHCGNPIEEKLMEEIRSYYGTVRSKNNTFQRKYDEERSKEMINGPNTTYGTGETDPSSSPGKLNVRASVGHTAQVPSICSPATSSNTIPFPPTGRTRVKGNESKGVKETLSKRYSTMF